MVHSKQFSESLLRTYVTVIIGEQLPCRLHILKKFKEIEAFWKELRQRLQPHIKDEIRASLDDVVFDTNTQVRDISETYYQTISPVKR